jgi:hypothetical protein
MQDRARTAFFLTLPFARRSNPKPGQPIAHTPVRPPIAHTSVTPPSHVVATPRRGSPSHKVGLPGPLHAAANTRRAVHRADPVGPLRTLWQPHVGAVHRARSAFQVHCTLQQTYAGAVHCADSLGLLRTLRQPHVGAVHRARSAFQVRCTLQQTYSGAVHCADLLGLLCTLRQPHVGAVHCAG